MVVASTGGAGCATAPTFPSSQRDLVVAKWDVDEFSDPLVLVALLSAGTMPFAFSRSVEMSSPLLTQAVNSHCICPGETRQGDFPQCAACLPLKRKLFFTPQTQYVTPALLWFLAPRNFNDL